MDKFMSEVLDQVKEEGSLIARVFPADQDVLLAYADRVAVEVVSGLNAKPLQVLSNLFSDFLFYSRHFYSDLGIRHSSPSLCCQNQRSSLLTSLCCNFHSSFEIGRDPPIDRAEIESRLKGKVRRCRLSNVGSEHGRISEGRERVGERGNGEGLREMGTRCEFS